MAHSAEPYHNSRDHLFDELKRIDLLLRRAIVIARHRRATAPSDEFEGLFVPEERVNELLASEGLPSCRSRLFFFEDRAYLEVERFDRVGAEGRRGAVSLYAIDLSRYARLDSWGECASNSASCARCAPDCASVAAHRSSVASSTSPT